MGMLDICRPFPLSLCLLQSLFTDREGCNWVNKQDYKCHFFFKFLFWPPSSKFELIQKFRASSLWLDARILHPHYVYLKHSTEKSKSWQQQSAQIDMYRNLTSCVSAWGELQPNASWVRKSIHIAAPNVSGAETQQGCSSQRILLHHVPSELSISWKLHLFSRNLPFNKKQQRDKF